jgi:hypothetical protein
MSRRITLGGIALGVPDLQPHVKRFVESAARGVHQQLMPNAALRHRVQGKAVLTSGFFYSYYSLFPDAYSFPVSKPAARKR